MQKLLAPKPAYTIGTFQYFRLYICPNPGTAADNHAAVFGLGFHSLFFRCFFSVEDKDRLSLVFFCLSKVVSNVMAGGLPCL